MTLTCPEIDHDPRHALGRHLTQRPKARFGQTQAHRVADRLHTACRQLSRSPPATAAQIGTPQANCEPGLDRRRLRPSVCDGGIAHAYADTMTLEAATWEETRKLCVDFTLGDVAPRELFGTHGRKIGQFGAAVVLPGLRGQHRRVQFGDQLCREFRKAEVDLRSSVCHDGLRLRRRQRYQVRLEIKTDAPVDLHPAAGDVALCGIRRADRQRRFGLGAAGAATEHTTAEASKDT